MRNRSLRRKQGTAGDVADQARGSRPIGGLSFDVDEEPSIHAVKKPTRKHQQLANSEIRSDRHQNSLTQRSAEGSYTAEKIEELKKATMSIGLPRCAPHSIQPVFKITGSFKPPSPPQSLSASEAFVRIDAAAARPPAIQPADAEMPESGFIPPNDHTIETAKAKRIRLRQAKLAPDYLPLGGTTTLLSQESRRDHKRDSSESDAEEDHMRLQFIGKTHLKRKVIYEEGEPERDIIEDEDAVDRFVDAQIRKGITAMGASEKHQGQLRNKRHKHHVEEICELPVVNRQIIAERKAEAIQKLQEAYLTQVQHLDNVRQKIQTTAADLKENDAKIAAIKERISTAEESFEEFQELREFVGDLCACLTAKIPLVEEVENQMQSLYDDEEQRLKEDMLSDQEGRELAEIASSTILEKIAADGILSRAKADGERAVKAQELQWETNASADAARRRRRMRRYKWESARQLSSAGDFCIQNDPFERRSLENELKQMRLAATDVFSDVLPELGSVKAITNRFEQLKKRHPSMYTRAHISKSLPALLAPFIRCEILEWSPLYGTLLGLETQTWYSVIESYGNSEDGGILPEIVKQIVVPVARSQIEKCWSPFDSQTSFTVSEMIRELLVYVDASEPEMEELLSLVQLKLSEAVGVAGIPPYTRPVLQTSEVVNSVMEYQFRSALHLMTSLSSFVEVLSTAVVEGMLLGEVVCQKLLPFLRSYVHLPVAATQKALALFSRIPAPPLDPDVSGVNLSQATEVLGAVVRALSKHVKDTRVTNEERELVRSFVDVLHELGKNELAASMEESMSQTF